ncbi:uncharacterized protein LOC121321418 isoform X6 [Polyodon spathula]|uniref:uncharacterized protein LOC121321418 isoform X6 n=1 Tax=Polyodon spathula TaxID=7913 RepID=UPI001B7DE05B|nr:uncharacterized protein LOC121321418 isoform X6 [Polyodon spathula]
MNRSVKMSAERLQAAPSSVFYKAVDGVEEILSGYLVKSPPSGPFFYPKSWKRRFFVLCKTPDNVHLLKYCKDEDDRDKPLGVINLSVQDVDTWFNAIISVLTSISKVEPLRNTVQEQERLRSKSESNAKKAMNDLTKNSSIQQGATCKSFTADHKLRPQSLSESYYSVPKPKVGPPPKPEPTENPNLYMPMTSVLRVVEEAQSDQNRVSTPPASGNIADIRKPHDFHFVKREVYVIEENLKNHLTLGKPCVAHWLSSLDDGYVLYEGDQIIAVNDLGTNSTPEVQTCLSKNNNEETQSI